MESVVVERESLLEELEMPRARVCLIVCLGWCVINCVSVLVGVCGVMCIIPLYVK